MKIGIIGCGHMGGGIARRLADHHEVFLYGRQPQVTEKLAKEINAKSLQDVSTLIEQVELIIIAVKPKDLEHVANQIAAKIKKNQILFSVLTGTTLNRLSNLFKNIPVVRMMPNMAVVQGEGVVGLSALDNLEMQARERIKEIFFPLGMVKWFPESMMDAVTSLTGSGPAFVLVMIESMVDVAIKMGFNAVEGQELVLQMIQGSLSMLKGTHKHPAELKWQITSPGGTTIAGLNELEACGVRNGIIKTFLAAYDQSRVM